MIKEWMDQGWVYEKLLLMGLVMILFLTVSQPGTAQQQKQAPFADSWDSLRENSFPKWLYNGKFGLWTHWGPYSVTGEHIWYPRRIFLEKDFRTFHENTYGPLETFGYHDLIPKFTAEKFDPNRWANLFDRAGARFAGPVAEHHDGFAMWDSKYTRWNAVNMGPKRDILEELARTIRNRNMKFVTSFHHIRKWWFFEPSYTDDDRYQTRNPKYAGVNELYPTPHKKGEQASKEYLDMTMGKVREVIDRYRPSLLFFDTGPNSDRRLSNNETFETMFRDMIAYYYNQGASWNEEVAIVAEKEDLQGDLVPDLGVASLERGREGTISQTPWMMLATIYKEGDSGRGRWSFQQDGTYRSSRNLLKLLVDVTSKNGVVWLNLGPKADGTIPAPQKQRVLDVGNWLDRNGEAVYGTQPWRTPGTGSVRFTKKDRSLFAVTFKKPNQTWTTNALTKNEASAVQFVQLLGRTNDLNHSFSDGQFSVKLPGDIDDQLAYAFRIKMDENVTGHDRYTGESSLTHQQPVMASNVYENNYEEWGPHKAVDGRMDTRWATDRNKRSPWFEIDLGEPTEIGYVAIEERKAFGNRVNIQKHRLQYLAEGTWKTIYEGGQIGEGFERTFDPVTAQRVRLKVVDATNGPTIRELRLFRPDDS